MSSARSDAQLLSSLRGLVEDNADKVLGVAGGQIRVEQLDLSQPRNQKPGRHHRALTVRYYREDERREKRIWLKFLKDSRTRYAKHTAIWNQTHEVCNLFPQPYFYVECNQTGMIAMELIEGRTLRDLFLPRMLIRRAVALSSVFAALGTALRAFHDSSRPAAFRAADDLSDHVRRLATDAEQLGHDERARLLDRIAAAAERAGGSAVRLPLIPIHHDCTMRNVVVRPDGTPCLLDVDAIVASPKTRWHELAVFLINLESQSKYAPLAHATSIAAAWRSFWTGYLDAGRPDGLSLAQVHAVLFLTKVDFLLAGTWRPLPEIYPGFLGARYLSGLKTSLLRGEHLIEPLGSIPRAGSA